MMETKSRWASFFLAACSCVYPFLVRQLFCYGEGVAAKGLQSGFHLLDQCCCSEMTINTWAAVFLTRSQSCGVLHTSKAWGESEEVLYMCLGWNFSDQRWICTSELVVRTAFIMNGKWGEMTPVSCAWVQMSLWEGERSAEVCRGRQVS